MSQLVYFSSVSGNTHRFVTRLAVPAQRIPVRSAAPAVHATEPYVLVTPTYGGGDGDNAVPRQVRRFLADPTNRDLLRAVIAAGNTNFGTGYCLAGPVIAARFNVPYLYGFELLGTAYDLTRVREGLEQFWTTQPSPSRGAA